MGQGNPFNPLFFKYQIGFSSTDNKALKKKEKEDAAGFPNSQATLVGNLGECMAFETKYN